MPTLFPSALARRVSFASVAQRSPARVRAAANSEQNQESSFLAYLHHFRAVAMLLVVTIHCLPFLDPAGSQSTLFTILGPLVDRSTWLFVFIGGFLFQHVAGKFEAKRFYRTKFRNVLLPYLLLSLPIIVVRLLTDTPAALAEARVEGFAQWPEAYQVLYYYATGLHLVPFWFMPMIALYYLLAPVLVRLDRQGGIYYGLPFFLALSLAVTRPAAGDLVGTSAIHFFSVYVLGMFVSRYRTPVLAALKRFRPAVVAALLVFTSLSIWAYDNGLREQTLFIQKLLLSFALLDALHRFRKVESWVLTIIADMSFGIYFLHFYVLYLVQAVYQKFTGLQYFDFTFLNLTGLLLLSVGASMVTLALLKKLLKGHSRWLVGY